jgi:hypothetical protein
VWQGANLNFIQIEHHNSSDKPMSPIEILQEFNSCYVKIQAIAQDENWLLLIADKKIDPEAATHLGDTLHYLGEVMGCVEEIVEVKFNQELEP